ncbi:hypothetical protein PHPALM_28680, partial [Phytophthora palmivora]
TLDKHCLKRENGGLTKNVYSTARVDADYQDAALACLMWHCFGRSSDLGYVQKQHVSVSADGAFYLRLLRVKTTEEQGLTLVPDKDDFLSCPLFTLSVALATQEAPCASLLGHLPALKPQAATPLDAGVPLHDLLAAEPVSLQVAVVTTPVPTATVRATRSSTPASTCTTVSSSPSQKKPSGGNAKRGEDSMQGHVNRMLKRVAEPAGVAADLTSHSFRRGGAQHANGDDHLAAQWIFDRGAWDMTKPNKAFAYIANTAREDRKVARVLSGWDADASPKVIDIAAQDHTTRERLRCLQELLFSTCTGLKEKRLNVSTNALSVLTAYLVRYFPQLKALAPEAPIVARVEECLEAAQICTADLLAWSMALNEEAAVCAQEQEKTEEKTHTCQDHGPLLAVIEELIASNRLMAARLAIVEAVQLKGKRKHVTTEQEQVPISSDQEPKPKRRKKQATNHAKGAESVLRALPPPHKSGALDERIYAYKRLFAIGRIEDPAPVDTQDILTIVGHV